MTFEEQNIPEIRAGYNMQIRVKDSTDKVEQLDYKYRSNEAGKLVVTSGFEIGCTYSIGIDYDNFLFDIMDGTEEEMPEMVKKLETLLKNDGIEKAVLLFGSKNGMSELGVQNFKNCIKKVA